MTRAAIAAAVALATAACGHRDREPAHGVAEPRPAAAPRPAPEDATAGSPVIPRAATQLITAIVADWSATTAELTEYRRDGDGLRRVDRWPAVIGRSGAAWGIGLHGDGPPAGRSGPRKREGDGASPAGAFALRRSYGYAATAPAGTALAYTPLDASWQCVDDPASPHYAQILDRRTVDVDWRSAETMRRADALYTWVIDVAHNPARTAGAGSCIFLHVWQDRDSTTVGCTAMAEERLAHLLSHLAPDAVFVLLPRAEYDALAPVWNLPASLAAAPSSKLPHRMSWKTILVPHDFSPSANHAAALARDEAKSHGARILLLHVIDLPHQLTGAGVVMPGATGAPISVKDYALASADAHIQDLAQRLSKDGVTVASFVRFGLPIDEIVRFTDEHAVDLIVMGTHGHTGIRHLIMGSVAERVVRSSRVPVLTVRYPDPAA